MSLASFHLIFILLSVLLSLGVGIFGIRSYVVDSNPGALAYGLGSLVLVPVLLVYGAKVWRKLKDLGAFTA